MKSKSDYPDAVQMIRDTRREAGEAGHKIDLAILLSRQVRQRPKQSFQKSDT